MPERIPEIQDRVGLLERDARDHAKSIGELVQRLRDVERDAAEDKRLRSLKDEHLDERLDRIEASIKSVYNLGKWLLGAAGSTLVVAIVGFALKGGPLG